MACQNTQCSYKVALIVAGLGALLLCGIIFVSRSVAYNATISEPIGWYWLSSVDEIETGKLYTIKLSSNYLPLLKKLGYRDNSISLLKRVLAKSGDKIEVKVNGVFVNGYLIKNSHGIKEFRHIMLSPLPVGYKRTLENGEYFVLGETRTSFDSRYFGVIGTSSFMNQATLIMKE